MAKAKKQSSGKWRCQVYDYTDKDGKIHRRSFTADTKKEAEFLAAQFLMTQNADRSPAGFTVGKAVDKYIDAKAGVLSPATVREYRRSRAAYFDEIADIPLMKLTNMQVQIWVSNLSSRLNPKTVRNIHALLASALNMFYPDFRLRTQLPQKKKSEMYTPNDEDIRTLLAHIAGTDLEIAVLLAAFGPLRRGEICALTSDDVHGNSITINKAMVSDENGNWVIKTPKTYSSNRTVEFPPFIIEKLQGREGRLVNATPNQITNRFRRAVRSSGLPYFRFHALRHYSASIMHAMGVPDQYIMARGGWSSDGVLKAVYRETLDDQTVKFNKEIFNHFEEVAL